MKFAVSLTALFVLAGVVVGTPLAEPLEVVRRDCPGGCPECVAAFDLDCDVDNRAGSGPLVTGGKLELPPSGGQFLIGISCVLGDCCG